MGMFIVRKISPKNVNRIKSSTDRWTMREAHTGEVNICTVLVRKRGGNKPLGKRSCRLEDDIKVNVKYIYISGGGFVSLAYLFSCFTVFLTTL
jgi:hypothetical protein